MTNLFASFLVVALVALLGMVRQERGKRTELERVRDELASSEEYLRVLLDTAPEGVIELDGATGRFISFNENAARLLGREGREPGGDLAQVSPPRQPDGRSSTETVRERLQEALSGSNPIFEWNFADPKGGLRPTEVRLVRMPQPGRVRASITDISEQVKARETLRESEARFRTLVDYATEAIVLLDVETMSFAEINQKAVGLFGYSREAFGRLEAIDLFPSIQPGGQDTRELMDDAMRQVLAGQGLVETQVVARRADGKLFNASLRSVLLPGARPQVRSTIIDVTDHIRKEEILQVAKEEAEKANRAKTAFLAHMSHEIRTPMNGVLGMLGLLMDSELTRDQRQSAELARSSAESLLGILNDVLDISKIEAGQFDLERIPFDLHAVVNSVVGVLAPRAFENGVELACEIRPEVPRRVVGDPHRLRQVLSNLVSNAVKFTQDGEVVVRVDSRGGADLPSLAFSVRDTGTGIPADRLESIFQPFVQADASVTRRFGGTGLGLAICRQLVSLMGGGLEVESEPGRGSEFRFELSLEAAAPEESPESQAAASILSHRRVLALDENPTRRRILRDVLERAGLRVVEAGDHYSALRAARIGLAEGDPFELAIVDGDLTDDGSFEFAREIRGDPNLSNLPSILLVAPDCAAAPSAEALGIAACLNRPVPDEDLMDAVEDILEGREAGAVSPARARRRTKNEPKAGLRVLLAEDNAVNQRVATAMLRRRGHEVDVVDNGLAAVEAVRERPYDVVLMDVQMPELDGLEAARRIRGEGFTDLRIVALTAHATTDDRDRCLDAGMNGFLTKPFESRDLFGAVEADSPGPRRRASSVPERTRNPVDLAAFTATMREAGVGEIVGDTLRAYLAEGPDRIRALQDGMASGDSEAVRKAAHALKSSSSAIGARRLADVLEETERESRLGSADRLRGLIGEVLGEYRAVVEQLEHSLAVRA